MNVKYNLLISLLVLFSAVAGAKEYLVEPYVGLAKTQIRQNSTRYYDVADGFFLGIKLGKYFGQKYLFGADYHSGGPYKFGPLISNSEWNHTMLGVGIGVNYSVVRYWLGYYFRNSYEDRTYAVKYIGTGIKAGIGFAVSSKLSCNFELLYSAINKATLGGFEADFSGYDISSAHVSVSFPL